MEPAEGLQAPAGKDALCSQQPSGPDRPPPSQGVDHGSAGFWRPWVDVLDQKREEKPEEEEEEEEPYPASQATRDDPRNTTEVLGKLSQYRHPVRLFWPKSKCYDYLYQEAEALLKNFPIQATISFYEDSDSEDEIEDLTCEN